MDEMEVYRNQIENHYRDRRRVRRPKNGRRSNDFKEPKFWTWGFLVQLLTLLAFGLVLALGGE